MCSFWVGLGLVLGWFGVGFGLVLGWFAVQVLFKYYLSTIQVLQKTEAPIQAIYEVYYDSCGWLAQNARFRRLRHREINL